MHEPLRPLDGPAESTATNRDAGENLADDSIGHRRPPSAGNRQLPAAHRVRHDALCPAEPAYRSLPAQDEGPPADGWESGGLAEAKKRILLP